MNITDDWVTMHCCFTRHNWDCESLIKVYVMWFKADPFAVHASFRHPRGKLVRWVWSRELLAEGLTRAAGDQRADIYIQPNPEGSRVVIELNSPAGYLPVSIDLATLSRFILETCKITPFGQEYADVDVDGLLHNWLGEAAA